MEYKKVTVKRLIFCIKYQLNQYTCMATARQHFIAGITLIKIFLRRDYMIYQHSQIVESMKKFKQGIQGMLQGMQGIQGIQDMQENHIFFTWFYERPNRSETLYDKTMKSLRFSLNQRFRKSILIKYCTDLPCELCWKISSY